MERSPFAGGKTVFAKGGVWTIPRAHGSPEAEEVGAHTLTLSPITLSPSSSLSSWSHSRSPPLDTEAGWTERIRSPPGPWRSPGSPSFAAAGTGSRRREGSQACFPPQQHSLPGACSPATSSAEPGWGPDGPSGLHRRPSASGSAGRPPPGVSAPWKRDKLLSRPRKPSNVLGTRESFPTQP